MKKFLVILLVIIISSFPIYLCACSNNDAERYIDVSAYFNENAIIVNDGTSSSLSLSQITGKSSPSLGRYSELTLQGKTKWTYDLYVESIEFDICSNEDRTFDMSLIISNIVQSETAKYNAYYQWHFIESFYVEIKANELTHKKINVNETFNDKAGGIAITIDPDSTLASSSLQFYITNLKITAYHN